MNDNKHTPEPWTAKQSCLYGNETMLADKDGHYIASIRANSDLSDGDSQDIASRIVACVNACAGAKTEDLEGLGSDYIKVYAQTIKQRDELLAALTLIASGEAENGSILSSGECQRIAYDAIASVKGEQ